MVGFGKPIDELLQIRIFGNHKSRNGNVQFPSLLGFVVAFIDNIFIETIAVHVIGTIFLADATRFAIGNHENLLVGVALSAQ